MKLDTQEDRDFFDKFAEGLYEKFIEEKMKRLSEDDTQNTDDDQNQRQDADSQQAELENPVAEPVNEDATGDEQIELNAQRQADGTNPETMPSEVKAPYGTIPTSSEGAPLELADGTGTDVKQDSSQQYDAIDPNGQATISFEQGNYNNFAEIPSKVNSKIATVQKTVLPLVEAALIELLGNNKAFVGENFNATFTMNGDEPTIECQAVYRVELFIGTDIDPTDIQHDAKYLLDRVNIVPNITWNHCEIDCTEGKVNLDFVI